MKLKNRLLLAFVVFTILFLDQVSKFFADNFFQVACNKGGAFGLGGNFGFISGLVLGIVFWLILQEKKASNILGLSLIFGGGVSNFLDRVFIGCVRDFVDLKFFPNFNLADSAITIGAFLIFFNLIFRRQDADES